MPAVDGIRQTYNGENDPGSGGKAMMQKQKVMLGKGLAGIGIAAILAFAYSAYLSPAMVQRLADLILCF
jgi:hypothetical protein